MKHPEILFRERVEIYRQADRFERASGLLLTPESIESLTTIPGVVNSAFALELYLKCLRHIESGVWQKNKHLLKSEIFDKLTPTHQARIEVLYADWAKNASTSLATVSLHQHLEALDKTYPHWRYFHEHPTDTKSYAGMIIIPLVKQVIREDAPRISLP